MFLPIFSNEVIRINIGDEIYEREYPDTVEEYRKLVDGLVDMYNDLNSDYLMYLDNDERSSDELRNLISALENDNNRLLFSNISCLIPLEPPIIKVIFGLLINILSIFSANSVEDNCVPFIASEIM